MTSTPDLTLEIRTSPHIVSGYSVDTIMFNTVVALLPVVGFAVYAFGLTALVTVATAVATCLVTERLAGRASGHSTLAAGGETPRRTETAPADAGPGATRENTGPYSTEEQRRHATRSGGRMQRGFHHGLPGDWSAVITGLLLGLSLPAGLPLWMVVVGGVAALGVGKLLFGGLGANPFNPALVGRSVLQAAFPAAMTTWLPPFGTGRFSEMTTSTLAVPFGRPSYDGVAGATALARWKFEGMTTPLDDLSFGFVGGSIGETSSVLIFVGGAYLVVRNMMSWRAPLAILGVVALSTGLLHAIDPSRFASAGFMLSSGGLMLGAVFMATDPVTSPVTPTGRLVYGALIGGLVVVIRVWGGMPEGVMYAILLGNAATPQIDRLCQPTVYGTRGRRPLA